jgi:predicted TPR repeat methyltransferase
MSFLRLLGRALGKRSNVGAPAAPVDDAAALGSLFAAERFADMEAFARTLTQRHPQRDNGWKALGVALLRQARAAEAVAPFERAIALAPGDADNHVQLGFALQMQERFTDAETCYRRALETGHNAADVHWNLGNILKQLNRLNEAAASYRRSLELRDGDAKSHIVLGDVLLQLLRPAEAELSFRRALEFDPTYALGHSSLGIALKAQNRATQAEESLRESVRLNARNADVHNHLGTVLIELGRLGDAEASFRQALAIDADHADAAANLGLVLGAQGKTADALAHYRFLLEHNPEDEISRHYHDALSGNASDAAPSAYVANLFDNFAGNFESHLVKTLDYRIPEKLIPLIVDNWHGEHGKDLLDLGCGTGLLGAGIAAHTRELVGVDLSAKMLDKARARNIYTRLENANLLDALRVEAEARYDAVTATDVFVYIGKIDAIVAETKRVLRPGGLFGFSVEAFEAHATGTEHDAKLLMSGRYAHASAYLRRLAGQYGFTIVHFSATDIRMERGAPIAGWLALWQA